MEVLGAKDYWEGRTPFSQARCLFFSVSPGVVTKCSSCVLVKEDCHTRSTWTEGYAIVTLVLAYVITVTEVDTLSAFRYQGTPFPEDSHTSLRGACGREWFWRALGAVWYLPGTCCFPTTLDFCLFLEYSRAVLSQEPLPHCPPRKPMLWVLGGYVSHHSSLNSSVSLSEQLSPGSPPNSPAPLYENCLT